MKADLQSYLSTQLGAAWSEQLRHENEKRKRHTAPLTVWASRFSKCTRAMVHDLLWSHKLPEFPEDSQNRMALGSDIEDPTIYRLKRGGKLSEHPFEVQGEQVHFTIHGRRDKKLPILSGKLDGWVLFQEGPLAGTPIPLELKHGDGIRRIETLADFDHSPWTAHMPYQLLAYCVHIGSPFGVFMLRKPGGPSFIPIETEALLDKADDFFDRAETAKAFSVRWKGADENGQMALGNELIALSTKDPAICTRCRHFQQTCFPEVQFTTDDPLPPELAQEVEECLTQMEANEQGYRSYQRADKALKARVRGRTQTVIGPYVVTGKGQKKTVLELPEDLRKKYSRTIQAGDEGSGWRTAWERMAPRKED